jgi:co-chaperonin GroES (HSP10)
MSSVRTGRRIGNECFDAVSASTKIRPLRDQLVVEPIPWPFSDIIEVAYAGRPLRGRVLAAGPGTYPKRYDGPKGKRTKMWDSKAFRPCDVKVGDVVQLNNITEDDGSIDGMLFQTFRWGNRNVVICQEADVTGIET